MFPFPSPVAEPPYHRDAFLTSFRRHFCPLEERCLAPPLLEPATSQRQYHHSAGTRVVRDCPHDTPTLFPIFRRGLLLLLHSIVLQQGKYSQDQCFVCPSDTEDIVRVYAEVSSQEAADSIANSMAKLVD
ncbi:hypothetical protein AHAS_Ahas03G0305900 [Arachis hypogaea]